MTCPRMRAGVALVAAVAAAVWRSARADQLWEPNPEVILTMLWPCPGTTFEEEGEWWHLTNANDGSPIYVSEGARIGDGTVHYLFYDKDCDGPDGPNTRSGWFMSRNKPDTCRDYDLDNDQACIAHAARVTDDASMPPSGDWSTYCCQGTGCQPTARHIDISDFDGPFQTNLTELENEYKTLTHVCSTTSGTTTSITISATTSTVTSSTVTTGTATTRTSTQTSSSITGTASLTVTSSTSLTSTSLTSISASGTSTTGTTSSRTTGTTTITTTTQTGLTATTTSGTTTSATTSTSTDSTDTTTSITTTSSTVTSSTTSGSDTHTTTSSTSSTKTTASESATSGTHTSSTTHTVTHTTTAHTTTETSTITTMTAVWSFEGNVVLSVPSGSNSTQVETAAVTGISSIVQSEGLAFDTVTSTGATQLGPTLRRLHSSSSWVNGAGVTERRMSTQGAEQWDVGFIVVGSGGGLVLPAWEALQQLLSTSSLSQIEADHFAQAFEQQGWDATNPAYGLQALNGGDVWNWDETTITNTTTSQTTTSGTTGSNTTGSETTTTGTTGSNTTGSETSTTTASTTSRTTTSATTTSESSSSSTTSSTTSTTNVCQIPDNLGVPTIDLSVTDPNMRERSGLEDVVRVECQSKFPGSICYPVCGFGWEIDDNMTCVVPDGEYNGAFIGNASCRRKTCTGGPTWKGRPGTCIDAQHDRYCTVECPSGCESTGVDEFDGTGGEIRYFCNNSEYIKVDDLECRAARAWADDLPSLPNALPNSQQPNGGEDCGRGVVEGGSCTLACEEGYEAANKLSVMGGVFFAPPQVCVATSQEDTLEDAETWEYEFAVMSEGLSLNKSGISVEQMEAALSLALELNVRQVFVTSVKDFNTSWDTQLPTEEPLKAPDECNLRYPAEPEDGLHVIFYIRPYPRDLEEGPQDLQNRVQQLSVQSSDVWERFRAYLAPANRRSVDGATSKVSPFRQASNRTYKLPTARWQAYDTFGQPLSLAEAATWGQDLGWTTICDNQCGDGFFRKDVRCETRNEDLCNANSAAPGWNKEALGLDDARACAWFGGCDYDWRCPSGVDPVSGECGDGEAESVQASVGLSTMIAALACMCYVRRHSRTPMCGKCDIYLNNQWMKVGWERRYSPGDDRERIVYELEDGFIIGTLDGFGFHHHRLLGNLTLIPLTQTQLKAWLDAKAKLLDDIYVSEDLDPEGKRSNKVVESWGALNGEDRPPEEARRRALQIILESLTEGREEKIQISGDEKMKQPVHPNVDIDISGKSGSFQLSCEVRTLASNGFIFGKCFTGELPQIQTGTTKMLVMQGGVLSLQFGEKFVLRGATKVNDGNPHTVAFGYFYADGFGFYYLLVDNSMETMLEALPIPDPAQSHFVKGYSTIRRDGDFSEIVSLSDSMGVDFVQEFHTHSRPSLDGDIDRIFWSEYIPSKGDERFRWFTFSLHVQHQRAGRRGNAKNNANFIGDDQTPCTAAALGGEQEDVMARRSSAASSRRNNQRFVDESSDSSENESESDSEESIRGPRLSGKKKKKEDNTPAPFEEEERMEYWSSTNGVWVPCVITSRDGMQPVREALQKGNQSELLPAFNVEGMECMLPTYRVYIGLAHTLSEWTSLLELRHVFYRGESVSFYSNRHRKWLKARVRSVTSLGNSTIRGYDVTLLRRRQLGRSASKSGVSTGTTKRLDRVPPHLLRPRFEEEEAVEVYRGTQLGWQSAHVIHELQEEEMPRESTLAVPTPAAHVHSIVTTETSVSASVSDSVSASADASRQKSAAGAGVSLEDHVAEAEQRVAQQELELSENERAQISDLERGRDSTDDEAAAARGRGGSGGREDSGLQIAGLPSIQPRSPRDVAHPDGSGDADTLRQPLSGRGQPPNLLRAQLPGGQPMQLKRWATVRVRFMEGLALPSQAEGDRWSEADVPSWLIRRYNRPDLSLQDADAQDGALTSYSSLRAVLEAGKQARGADAGDSYEIGDVARGVVASLGSPAGSWFASSPMGRSQEGGFFFPSQRSARSLPSGDGTGELKTTD